MKKIIFFIFAILVPDIGFSQGSIFEKMDKFDQLADGNKYYSVDFDFFINQGHRQVNYNYKNMSAKDIETYRESFAQSEAIASQSNHYEYHENDGDTISYRILIKKAINNFKLAVSGEIIDHGKDGMINAIATTEHNHEDIIHQPIDSCTDTLEISRLFHDAITQAHVKAHDVVFSEKRDKSEYRPEYQFGKTISLNGEEDLTTGKLYIFPDSVNEFCKKFEHIIYSCEGHSRYYKANVIKGIGKSLGKNYRLMFAKSPSQRYQDARFYLAIVYLGKLRLLEAKSKDIFLGYIPAYWFMTTDEKMARNIK